MQFFVWREVFFNRHIIYIFIHSFISVSSGSVRKIGRELFFFNAQSTAKVTVTRATRFTRTRGTLTLSVRGGASDSSGLVDDDDVVPSFPLLPRPAQRHKAGQGVT